MKTITIDIETIPAPEDKKEVLGILYEKYVKKSVKYVKKDGDSVKTFEEFYRDTSLDGAFGQILCIVYAINMEEPRVLRGNEVDILNRFWEICADADLLVGHNILDFDLKFIVQRSIVHKIQPSKNFSFARFQRSPIYDTMQEWNKWSYGDRKGLEHIAFALGIPSPKGEGIDGSQVYDFYLAGKINEICEYCVRDVVTTREVYKRLNYSD